MSARLACLGELALAEQADVAEEVGGAGRAGSELVKKGADLVAQRVPVIRPGHTRACQHHVLVALESGNQRQRQVQDSK